jgi:phytol kinase
MQKDILNTLLLAVAFLVLFAVAEILHRIFHMKAEYSRKVVHVMTGLITLLFPVMLSSHWYVLFLCASFLLILLLSLKYKLLPSINNIDRVSVGSISYPIAVYVCFFICAYYNNYIYFYLPILILAICDPLAALVGKSFPKGKYIIIRDQKTLVGSSAFLLSAVIVSFVLLNRFKSPLEINAVWLSFCIAIVTCFAEAVSQKGYDNLAIPFSALGVLVMML